MSDLRPRAIGRVIAGVALAAALAARAGDAQQPEPQQQVQLQRLHDRLLSAARISNQLRDSAEYLRTHRWIELPPDSLSAGPLRFKFVEKNLGADLKATLQAAAQGAASVADSTFGDAAAAFLGDAPIVVSNDRWRVSGWSPSFGIVVLEIANGGGRSTIIRSPITKRRIEDGILDLVGTMATAHLLDNAVQWGGEWVPAQRMTRDRWEDAAVDLASSNAAIARTCYAGSIPACESALGLTKVADPLMDWFSPEGWRVLISEWHPPKEDYVAIAARADCVEKKIDSICLRLSRARPVPIPLSFATRSTLFATALERGGRSAYARLVAAKGTPMEVLSIAAGVGADSLIGEWRSRVLASTPPSSAPTPLDAALFVGWTVAFGIAATRKRP
jgi:hypothetical protein